MRTLCNWKKIRIAEAEVCPDHVHMLVEIPPKVAVSSFMGYLKGKSSLMIYEKYPELRYKQESRLECSFKPGLFCKGVLLVMGAERSVPGPSFNGASLFWAQPSVKACALLSPAAG